MRRAPKQPFDKAQDALRSESKDARPSTGSGQRANQASPAIVQAGSPEVPPELVEGPVEGLRQAISENDVKLACIEYLWRLNWLVLRVNQGAVTQEDKQTGKRRHVKFATWYALGNDPLSAGISDILALDPSGRLWAVECKAPGKLANVSEAQGKFLAAVAARGGVAIVIDDFDTLVEEIKKRLT
jgi:hypothetical protein